MKPPAWTLRLVEQVARDHGVPVPRLVMREGTGLSGSTYPGSHISISTYRWPMIRRVKALILHEMAHWIRNEGERDITHGDAFYRLLYGLAERYGTGRSVILREEWRYREQSIRTAQALGVTPPAGGYRALYAKRRDETRKAAARYGVQRPCPLPLGTCRFSKIPDRPHTHSDHLMFSDGQGGWWSTRP